MKISEEVKQGINVGLNEAQVLGIEFNKDKETIAVTFVPVAITKDRQVPEDNLVQFVFKPIGRFVASYRLGRWDDSKAEIVKFAPEEIFEKVAEFQHLPIYGWEFIDNADKQFDTWKNRLSFDYNSNTGRGLEHTIDLFQEGSGKHIDIRIWFDDFELYNSKYEKIAIEDFIENGKRGWSESNPEKFGIYGLKNESKADKS